jgi:hypothetical protein
MKTFSTLCAVVLLVVVSGGSRDAAAAKEKDRFSVKLMATGKTFNSRGNRLVVHVPGLGNDLIIRERIGSRENTLSNPRIISSMTASQNDPRFIEKISTGQITPEQAKRALELLKGRRMQFTNGTGYVYTNWNPFPQIRTGLISMLKQIAEGSPTFRYPN